MINEIEEAEQLFELLEALKTLDQRDQMILTALFGLDGTKPKTLMEVGFLLRRTRSRVASLRQRAVHRLHRKMLNLRDLAHAEGRE